MKKTIVGRGLRIELDRTEAVEGGTPAMVYAASKGVADAFSASFSCALDQGELTGSGDSVKRLTEKQGEWLEEQEQVVANFLYPSEKFQNGPNFELGQIVATAGALDKLDSSVVNEAIQRHSMGDWGEVDAHNKGVNDRAVKSGGRLLSQYTFDGVMLWVITEGDRSVTTALLPSEY